jgi:hypothetical protein
VVLAVRWVAQQARIYLSPKAAAREVRRLFGDESTVPRKKRTRQTGVLQAVLEALKPGPTTFPELLTRLRFKLPPLGDRGVTRAQILPALRYAAHKGYIELGHEPLPFRRAVLTDTGRARLKPADPLLAPVIGSDTPGESFPAKFGVPQYYAVDSVTGKVVTGPMFRNDQCSDLRVEPLAEECRRLEAIVDGPPTVASGCETQCPPTILSPGMKPGVGREEE